MTGPLARLVDVRSGEHRAVLQAFLALLCLIAGHTVLETARDALFLGMLPASRLAWVYLLLAALGLLVPWYSAAFIRRFGRRDAVVFSLLAGAFGTTWLHFQPITPTTVYVVYGWSGLLATVMVVQFWMLAGELFSVTQGKRIFPLLAAGGVLGAAAGGVLAASTLRLIRDDHGVHGAIRGDPAGARLLLLLSAALFVVAALAVASAATDDRGGGAPHRKPARAPALLQGLAELREEPYVARLAVLVALSSAALLGTDYLFKFTAKASLPSEELGPFFARYYALMNGAALLMQLFVAMRVVQRLGVAVAMTILPLALLGGGVGVLLLGGGLTAVLLTRGADGALRHSLHRVSSELLFLPLSAEVRERAKSLIDSVVARFAQALTAAVILGVAAAGLESVRVLAAMVALLAGAWALAAMALRRGHLDLFRKMLSRGALDPALRFEDLDVRSVESVMDALSSPDEVRVVAAMDLIAQGGRTRLIPALILYHESPNVLERALAIIARRARGDWVPHAKRLLAHQDARVRLGALRALGRAEQLEPLQKLLDHDDRTLRAMAAFYVARSDRAVPPQEHPAIAPILAAIPRRRANGARAASSPPPELDDGASRLLPELDDSSNELRIALLDGLRSDGDPRWAEVLLHLADCPDDAIIERAALAMAQVSDPRFAPLLIRRLAHRKGRGAAREALVHFGERALDALAQALADPLTPAAVRLHIPRTVSRFGTQRAADLLTSYLAAESDGAVRYKVLRGLGSLVARHDVTLDRKAIELEIERNLIESLRLLARSAPLELRMGEPSAAAELGPRAHASGRLLVGLLADKRGQAIQRAFRLFQLLHRSEDVRGIYLALWSADARRRAAASEFLDGLAAQGQARCRALFGLVADDLDPDQRIVRAAPFVPEPPEDAAHALRLLIMDPDAAVAELSAYHVNTLRDPELRAELGELCAGRPSLGLFGERDATPRSSARAGAVEPS